MSRALRGSEPPLSGLRRILTAELDDARRQLHRGRLSDRRVHDVRKELKRARASLRLLRGALGDAAYRRANRLLRDAARPLTPLRDAKVLVELLDERIARDSSKRATSAYTKLRRRLETSRRHMRVRLPAAVASADPKLRAVRARVRALPTSGAVPGDFAARLADTYRKARKAFVRAQAHPNDAELHEWRKQVKYLLAQLELLEPLRPRRTRKLAKRADRLAHLLGDDHDLAVLEQTLGARDASLARDRTKLQRQAHRLGERLHRKSPRRFARPYEKRLG